MQILAARPGQAYDCFRKPAQDVIHHRQIVVRFRHIPLKLDDALNVLKSKLMLAHLVGDHSDEPDRLGMIRLHLENLPVDQLGRWESARLMMPHGHRGRRPVRRAA
jgi:hypothetical protein